MLFDNVVHCGVALLVSSLVLSTTAMPLDSHSPAAWPEDLPEYFNWCDKGGCGLSRGQCDGGCQMYSWYANVETQYWASQGAKGPIKSVSAGPFLQCILKKDRAKLPGTKFGWYDKHHGIYFEETYPFQGMCNTCGQFDQMDTMAKALQKKHPERNFTNDPCLVKQYFFKYKLSADKIKAEASKAPLIDDAQQRGWPDSNNSTVHSQYGSYEDCKANYNPSKDVVEGRNPTCICPQNVTKPIKPDVPANTYDGMWSIPILSNISKMARVIQKWGPGRTAMDGVESFNEDVNSTLTRCPSAMDHDVVIVGWDRRPKVPKWIIRNSMRPNLHKFGLTYVPMDCGCAYGGSCGHMASMQGSVKVIAFSDPNVTKGDSRGTWDSLVNDFGAVYQQQP